jgi:3-hydroxyisobutyrate dehydrogenase-like beta-hydroxyacid dehydrogenase
VTRVAFLGLGAMGTPMARRLEAAGDIDLVVWNRSPGPAEPFAQRGVSVADSPAAAASGADICISMLADGSACERVLLGDGGALDADVAPGLLAEMSTLDVETSRRIAIRAADAGVDYLRAPVSGNPTVVEAGRLTILVSGDTAALERARPVLADIGPVIFHLGDAEEARVMKLALAIMIGISGQMLAETLCYGEAHGLDRAQMLEVIGESAVGSPFTRYKAAALVADDYSTTFSARLMHKDLRLIVSSANEAGVPVPVVSLVQQLVQGCIGAGMGDMDFMTLLPRLAREAGLRSDIPTQELPA